MNRHSGIWIKFFAAFFFIGAVALLLTGIQMYYGAQSGIIKLSSYSLESMRNMKKVIFENYMDSLQAPIKGFADSITLFGAKEMTANFEALSNIDSDVELMCSSQFDKYITKHIEPENRAMYFPKNIAGVLLKCIEYQSSMNDENFVSKLTTQPEVIQYRKIADTLYPYFNRFVNHWDFSDILLISPKGDIIFTYSKNHDLGLNIYSDNLTGDYLRQAVEETAKAEEGDIQFFDFSYYAPENMTPVMLITIPLKTKSGLFLGTLIHTVKPYSFDKILSGGYRWERDGFGVTGDVFIAGSDGTLRSNQRLFLTSRDEYINKISTTVSPEKAEKLEKAGTSVLLLDAPHLDMSVFEGFSGTKEYISKNERVLVSYAPLVIQDMNWAIVTTISMMEMNKHTAEMDNSLIRSSVAVLATVFILTIMLTYVFTRPIKRIQESFHKISKGDLKAKVCVNGNDELKDLADSFNVMVDKLSAHESENTKTTAMLQAERDFITAVLDLKGIYVIVIDETNDIVRVNNPVTDLTGRDLIGKNYLDVLPRKYKTIGEKAVAEARTANATPYVFTKGVSNSGTEIFIDWMISTISNGSRFTVFIGIDVSERYRTQETLRANEAMLQIIMSHAQDAIIISDSAENINMWNEAAGKMLGYTFAEMKGCHVVPTIIPEDYRQIVEDACNAGQIIDTYAYRRNGERFPVEISVSKVKVRGRTSTFYIIRDSSIRKKRESELYNALEKAKVAEKAKSEFLANMSHEVRTPLNGILGFLNLLKQTPLQKDQYDYLKIIDSSTESLLAIINEILDFSKIESGKMQLEKLEFCSWQEFEQIAELYSAKAREKNIDLLLHLDPRLPEIFIGDPFRLRQILTNLLSNAVKFTPERGTIAFTITMLELNEKHCKTRISVKDTGIGISKDKQATIFGAFSQEDSSVTRKYGGSGLGLAICSKLVQLMDSSLHLHSEKNQGSDFFFTVDFEVHFPRMRNIPDLRDVRIAKYSCPEISCAFLDLDSEYIEATQCQISSFSTPEEYKNITPHPDIIFIGYNDCNTEILSWIDQHESNTPLVLVECENSPENFTITKRAHTKTITQPITLSKLISVVTSVMNRSGDTHLQENRQQTTAFHAHALLVEDNAVNRRLAYIMLTQLGLTVDTAENGREAVEKTVGGSYDIIFMDIHMPVLDGISATKEIIVNENAMNKPHTPIIALTANVIQKDRDIYTENGMNGFLAKPLSLKTLVDILCEFLPADKQISHLPDFISVISAKTGIKDSAILKNLLSEFYNLSNKQTQEMSNAIKNGLPKELLAAAFSMKGAASSLGLNNITQYCANIQAKCSQSDITDCMSTLNNIELELQQIKSSLG